MTLLGQNTPLERADLLLEHSLKTPPALDGEK